MAGGLAFRRGSHEVAPQRLGRFFAQVVAVVGLVDAGSLNEGRKGRQSTPNWQK